MKSKCYFLFLSVIAWMGCASDESDCFDKNNSPQLEILSLSKTISSDEAVSVAKEFMDGMSMTTRSTGSHEVSSVYPWKYSEIFGSSGNVTRGVSTESTDTMLYIVNFGQEEGYTLVYADKAMYGVVAYIEEGSLRPDDTIDNNGFKIFLDGLRGMRGASLENVGLIDYQPIWENIAPMLTTKWSQYAPYNTYCFTPDSQQAVAGCVAIATAQIAAYHRYPSSYNGHTYDWDKILDYETVMLPDTDACKSVGHLVHDIGLLVNMEYGVSESAAISYNGSLCWAAFGYNYTWNTTINMWSIRNSLKAGRPVYMQGKRLKDDGSYGVHAWVIDGSDNGIMLIPRIDSSGNPIIRKIKVFLVHCNWGNGGSNDGYFILGAFDYKCLGLYQFENGHPAYNSENFNYTDVYPIPFT